MEDSLVTKYKNITGIKQPSAESLERILKLKERLGITDDDGLWSIFITLDMYVRLIETFNAKIDTTFADALAKYRDKGGAINIIERDEDKRFSIANLMVIFGVVFALCLVSFFAGAMLSGSSPPWITETRASSAAAFIMQLPGGWIFFVVGALPGAYLFLWSVRKIRSEKGSVIDRLMSYGAIGVLAAMLVVAGVMIVWQMMS